MFGIESSTTFFLIDKNCNEVIQLATKYFVDLTKSIGWTDVCRVTCVPRNDQASQFDKNRIFLQLDQWLVLRISIFSSSSLSVRREPLHENLHSDSFFVPVSYTRASFELEEEARNWKCYAPGNLSRFYENDYLANSFANVKKVVSRRTTKASKKNWTIFVRSNFQNTR